MSGEVKDYPEVYWINQKDRKFEFIGDKSAKLEIGNDVKLNTATIDITGGIKIGDRVHFGHEVMLLTTDHPPEIKDGNVRRRTLRCAPIEIGDDAYLGSRVMVLKGVKIGKSAFIAAGALVIKDVPERELWAGSPAKLIRKL
jgi:acetyltransferase-like isoleucine patch superfamily enzyme